MGDDSYDQGPKGQAAWEAAGHPELIGSGQSGPDGMQSGWAPEGGEPSEGEAPGGFVDTLEEWGGDFVKDQIGDWATEQ